MNGWSNLPVAPVVLLLGALGCGAGEAPEPEAPPVPAAELVPVDPATVGVIRGVVNLTGTPPEPREIPLGSNPACSSGHDGPVFFDSVIVQEGKLKNAFVWVKKGLERTAFEIATNEVEIDQRGCIYQPRVIGVQVGQPVVFINSDNTTHNVHTVPVKGSGENFCMAIQGMRSPRTFKREEVMLKTKCDIHPWMGAYIGVVRHPVFAVSAADGAFELTGVPPGDYVVEAWHEKFGTLTQAVTLAASGEATTSFTFAVP